MASVFIAIAAVVDFFDGFVARLLKVPSELGKQLDSLADVVSFGLGSCSSSLHTSYFTLCLLADVEF